MGLLQKSIHALAHVRKHGILPTIRYARERFSESYHEWRLGIQTMGNLRPDEVGIDSPFAFNYYPADYRTIYQSLDVLQIQPGSDGFLDYGCGMGRVVVVAAVTLPFRRVIGVELSPELADLARANLLRVKAKLRCGDAQIITADAQTFVVPADINYVFFYSPFHGPVLAGALNNIRTSLMLSPRRLTVVFKNTEHFEPIMSAYPWLVKIREFTACDADHKVLILEAHI